MTVRDTFNSAGRSFARAFGIAFLLAAVGIAQATNLDGLMAAGLAAAVAGFAAGLRVLQDLVPQLQVPGRYGDYVGSFARAALASFLVYALGVLDSPVLAVDGSLVVAAIQGALTAGVLALQQLVQHEQVPRIT